MLKYWMTKILHTEIWPKLHCVLESSTAKLWAAISLPTPTDGVEHTKLEALEVIMNHQMKDLVLLNKCLG